MKTRWLLAAAIPMVMMVTPASPQQMAPDMASAPPGQMAMQDSPDHSGHAAHAGGHHGGEMAGPRDELGSSAVFDARGVMWNVAKQGQHVVVRQSSDTGRTWSPPVSVNATAEPIGADGDARPKLAFGANGEIYVTWTRPLSKPYTGLIRFSRSMDGGKTFSVPVTVHTDRQEITHRFDALAVNAKGQIFIAWVDKRDGEIARTKHEPYAGAAIYFTVSDDRGASFKGDFKLADHTCECCRIALLPTDDGSVLTLWRHVFAPNIRDHAIARMHADGTVDGFRRATYDNWAIDACPHHGPSLAADAKGQLHAVWFDLGPEHPGAVYGRLREGGVDGLRKVGGEGAEHPDLAILGERIAVVWKEFDGQKSQLRAMLSADNGHTWREMTLGSTAGASDQPRLLTRDSGFYVYWNTRQQPFSVTPLS
jgi:hypothetical protein